MKIQHLNSLVCPNDLVTPLDLNNPVSQEDDILSGHLKCGQCQKAFEISEGIPKLLPTYGQPEHPERQVRDQEAKMYDHLNAPFSRQIEIGQILKLAKIPNQTKILDAGCGTGLIIRELVAKPLDVWGCDLSFESLKFLKEHIKAPNLNLFQADITRLPFAQNTFDRVTSGQVLQHLPSHDHVHQALEEFKRVLNPGGLAVFSVFQYSAALKSLFKKVYKTELLKTGAWDNDLTYFRFEKNEMRQLTQSLGFKTRIHTTKHIPDRLGERFGPLTLGLESFFTRFHLLEPWGSFLVVSALKTES